ncbi:MULTISPECIES: glycosyltransferase family 2 protein [Acinetobacter]|uniref:glycosyltransferase family 2 protein n=1 Tax=Acinetobacter TaxID=469 RepID=UPI00051AEDF7|nr:MULTISPECIES: glycosyltransferase family 2 protein [Acinetobacter]MCH7294658.1 glycosyltransferase family 2 protein [Acinetobacter higginsii]MCH7380330.1 glycosyltransferase family 2 protein [Acinetobacter higginsii]MCJ0829826.1 glycosyltransferase family 2 protein [Acinetobacter sp. NIPH1876]MDO3665218.1 glycosyltransferase family 2 protein [Acinetobacter higginsii]
MINSPFLSCVVPAYNEAENLKKFIPALAQQLEQQNLRYEIIIIDDGSKDNSIAVLQQMLDDYPLRILTLSRNFGKEAALSAGLDYVTGDATLLIDADFQHPLNAIPTMIQLWKDGYDMVYGIRDRSTESWLKKIFTQGYYHILNLSSSVDIPENAGDFRLLDAKVVEAVRKLPEKNRYMKGLYAWVGFKSIGIHFTEQQRQFGQSSFNFKALFQLAMSGLTGFSDLPLRLCIYLGALLALFAMSYGIWIIIETMIEGIRIPGWATLAAGMTLLGGIQLLCIGILGEYIGRIYAEVKNRPKYIVAAEYSHNHAKPLVHDKQNNVVSL